MNITTFRQINFMKVPSNFSFKSIFYEFPVKSKFSLNFRQIEFLRISRQICMLQIFHQNYFLWIYANSNLSRLLRQIDLSNIWVFTVFFIKGGDTGNDCIGTSIRQGAKSITTFEILPTPPDSRGNDNPWPQYPRVFKVDYGHEEVKVKFGDDPRRFNTQSKEFLMDDNGRVSGIRTVLVQWTKVEGRWQMAEVPESEKIYPCQLVLLAMGFLGT